MIGHYRMDNVLRPTFRHMAAHAVAAGGMRLHCNLRRLVTPDTRLVIHVNARLIVPDRMRIVARRAAQFPVACEETCDCRSRYTEFTISNLPSRPDPGA